MLKNSGDNLVCLNLKEQEFQKEISEMLKRINESYKSIEPGFKNEKAEWEREKNVLETRIAELDKTARERDERIAEYEKTARCLLFHQEIQDFFGVELHNDHAIYPKSISRCNKPLLQARDFCCLIYSKYKI